jgi:hypothetical protein
MPSGCRSHLPCLPAARDSHAGRRRGEIRRGRESGRHLPWRNRRRSSWMWYGGAHRRGFVPPPRAAAFVTSHAASAASRLLLASFRLSSQKPVGRVRSAGGGGRGLDLTVWAGLRNEATVVFVAQLDWKRPTGIPLD